MMSDSYKAALITFIAILTCWVIWAVVGPAVLALQETSTVLNYVPDFVIDVGPPLIATLTIAIWAWIER